MTEKLLPDSLEVEKDLPSEVLTQISAIYPFLDKTEYDAYMEKAIKVEEENPIDEIAALIKLLDNPHATFRKSPPEKISVKQEVNLDKLPSGELIDNVLYMDIPSLRDLNLKNIEDVFLPYEDESEGIIMDLRSNRGGDEIYARQFAEKYFFKEGVHPAGTNIQIAPEGDLRQIAVSAKSDNIKSYDKPIVILTSNKTFSAAERFISRMRAGTECVLIGTETRGGSAQPVQTEIEHKGTHYTLRIPTWRYFLHGEDRPIEETKIKPDILYEDDDIVDFAIKHIKSSAKKEN